MREPAPPPSSACAIPGPPSGDGELVHAPRLMEAEDVATLLGMTVAWVWAKSRSGEIPAIKLGRNYRYRRESVLRWIEELEA